MSNDRREGVVARLKTIAAGIDGINKVERNVISITDVQRPAIIIYDGSEEAVEPQSSRTGLPAIVTMTAEMRILLGASPANVGTDINALRMAVMHDVLTDASLQTIIGANGRVRYGGCETELGQGRTLDGDMVMRFNITYPLLQAELS